MHVTSLAWRTHIETLVAAGSTVTDCGTHLFVTTAENPLQEWGNFMLLKELPLPGGAREVMGAYDTWFRDNRYRAIGVDTIDDVDLSEFEAAGMTKVIAHEMVAEDLRVPVQPPVMGGIRPLTSDEWGLWADLETSVLAAHPRERRGQRAAVQGRATREQKLIAAGLGQRWGVFVDGRLAASAALFDGGAGIYRFHGVAVHPRRRRQGLATQLTYRMASWARRERQARAVMLVADPESPARALSARMGMLELEKVTRLHQALPGDIA